MMMMVIIINVIVDAEGDMTRLLADLIEWSLRRLDK